MASSNISELHSREYIYEVEKNWDKLLGGYDIDEGNVRPVVMDSWQRCQEHGTDPTTASAPAGYPDAKRGSSLSEQRMRTVMRKSLNSVGRYLEEAQSVLIGSSRQGQLFFVEGDNDLSDNLAENAVTVGSAWDELKIGTNAVGTALREQKAVLIHGHEHFCVAGKQWSCAADVIRDPFDHSVLGVVDLTGPADAKALRASALISALVERIESELTKLDLADQLALIDCFHEQPINDTGLVIIDRRGKVIRHNNWDGLNHANLDHGRFVPGFQGLTPDQWSLDLTHESLRDSEIEWIHSGKETIGAAIYVGKKTPKPKKASLPDPLKSFIEVCPSLTELAHEAAILTDSSIPIVVTGETGVGKEVLSSAIHQSSKRAAKPFVAVNCSAFSKDLIGVELFGYVEGAFTGARRGGMAGRIEDANGGTLFLDEIGDMPLELQPYLLRVLESGQLSRIGESKSRDIDVRIIAATNQPLEDLVREGRFRADIFYRLNVARLHVPSLRNRPKDIVPLSYRIFDQVSTNSTVTEIDRKTLSFLMRHDFPGNVRELKSVVQRYALGLPIVSSSGAESPAYENSRTLAQIENDAIREALERHDGSVSEAAKELDVPKSTLYRRIARNQSEANA